MSNFTHIQPDGAPSQVEALKVPLPPGIHLCYEHRPGDSGRRCFQSLLWLLVGRSVWRMLLPFILQVCGSEACPTDHEVLQG